jgi:hypothetical protein
MCAVPIMAVFCSSLMLCFPGMLLSYFLNDLRWFHLPILLLASLFHIPHALYLYCKIIIIIIIITIIIAIEMPLDLHNSTSYHAHSYRKYASGDYNLLFRFLFNYDWSCVYSNNTVDAAVDSFTNVILQATDLAIPRVSLESPDSLTGFLTH